MEDSAFKVYYFQRKIVSVCHFLSLGILFDYTLILKLIIQKTIYHDKRKY